MCGIFGIYNIDKSHPLSERRFQFSLSLLYHRGPDARCHVQFENDVLLGHTRLSIIDLDDRSNQPMGLFNRFWIVYNGEVFNYIELKQELEDLGHRFVTESDTEVVLTAYVQWGGQCVERFNGMWAFAIYDRIDKILFCSRDRFGEKPFYYALSNGLFIFSSEIKAIIAYQPNLVVPDYNSISNFCRTSVGSQHSKSWFRDVLRLQPGHNLLIRNNKLNLTRYWDYPFREASKRSFVDLREEYLYLFRDSVRIRLRSDVPLGLTLSSGIDSSSIACVMHGIDPKPHHFFSSYFDVEHEFKGSSDVYKNSVGPINEAKDAQRLAEELGQNFHGVSTSYFGLPDQLVHIVYHIESGNSSPAIIPLMQLYALAKKHVTVVLEGQGADELLGGYITNNIWPAISELIIAGKLSDALKSYLCFSETYTLTYSVKIILRILSNRFPFLSIAHQKLHNIDKVFGPLLQNYQRVPDYPPLQHQGASSILSRVLQGQHSGGLVNLLHYGDALSMAHGLENRMPFMDYRLVEFVWGLPSEVKIKLGVGKYLHREAMRGLVPDRILDQNVKFGFNTPIADQFICRKGQRSESVDILLSQRCLGRGLFDAQGVKSLLNDHWSGRRNHGPLLFRLLMTELWFRTFVDVNNWRIFKD